jgi:hypothetical protein
MTAMAKFTDPTSGGVYEHRDFGNDPLQDTLTTAQLGVSALITGRRDVADGVASWLLRQYEDQPEPPDRYCSTRRDGRLVTDVPDEEAFLRALDYLRITTGAGDLQFDDPTSVQICKFGLGVAMTYAAVPSAELRPWVVRMAEWFTRRQQPDGSRAPASFMTPSPGAARLLLEDRRARHGDLPHRRRAEQPAPRHPVTDRPACLRDGGRGGTCRRGTTRTRRRARQIRCPAGRYCCRHAISRLCRSTSMACSSSTSSSPAVVPSARSTTRSRICTPAGDCGPSSSSDRSTGSPPTRRLTGYPQPDAARDHTHGQ